MGMKSSEVVFEVTQGGSIIAHGRCGARHFMVIRDAETSLRALQDAIAEAKERAAKLASGFGMEEALGDR